MFQLIYLRIQTEVGNPKIIQSCARGIDDYSLGEVRQVTSEYVITHKGIVNTKWFQIPKHLAQEFDGNQLIFKVSEKEAKEWTLNMSRPWTIMKKNRRQRYH